MGSYPWGPHGPQSGPNEVTPNPTPAWVPPAASDAGSFSYGAPAPAAPYTGGGYVGGGGGNASGAVYTGTYRPRPKSYILGLILSGIFGPFGLLYASKKGALVMFVLLLGIPVALAAQGAWGPAFHRHPLEILGRDAVMNRFWSISVFFSLIWSVIGVRGYNKRLK